MEMTAILPYPPSVNKIWRKSKNGIYLHPSVARFRKEVWALLFHKGKFENAQVRLEVKVSPPDQRRRDLDNILKALLDAIMHAGVVNDDSQVCQLYVERLSTKKGGEIEIKLCSM